MVYQTESYDYWERFSGATTCTGNFGENLTVDGLTDARSASVTGTASARPIRGYPAASDLFRVGMRLGEPEMPESARRPSPPGFLLPRDHRGSCPSRGCHRPDPAGQHELSVADIDALLYLPDRDMDQLRKAVDVPAFSPGWQQSFREMFDHRKPPRMKKLRRLASNRAGAGFGDSGCPLLTGKVQR